MHFPEYNPEYNRLSDIRSQVRATIWYRMNEENKYSICMNRFLRDSMKFTPPCVTFSRYLTCAASNIVQLSYILSRYLYLLVVSDMITNIYILY